MPVRLTLLVTDRWPERESNPITPEAPVLLKMLMKLWMLEFASL